MKPLTTHLRSQIVPAKAQGAPWAEQAFTIGFVQLQIEGSNLAPFTGQLFSVLLLSVSAWLDVDDHVEGHFDVRWLLSIGILSPILNLQPQRHD